jgi:hypothetical protein
VTGPWGWPIPEKTLVGTVEEGKLPPLIDPELLKVHLGRITKIISQMLDGDIFPGSATKPLGA